MSAIAHCLEIRLLGGIELSRNGEQLPAFPTREAEALFSFLALNRGRLFSREVLVDNLYADLSEAKGRKRLRNAIWRARSVVEPSGTSTGTYIHSDSRRLGLNVESNYWIDVEEFESSVTQVATAGDGRLQAEQAKQLNDAVTVYRGDLLEGIYEDWCLFQRERIKLLLLGAIERLMNHFQAKQDWVAALQFARQLLNHDPLREHIHRDVMQIYANLGDRPAVLNQYETCARILRDELDIEPMTETTALRNSVRDQTGSATQEKPGTPDPVGGLGDADAVCIAKDTFSSAIGHLDKARQELTRRIQFAQVAEHRPGD